MNALTRLHKRRRKLPPYQSIEILGKVLHAQVIYVLDRDLRERGRFTFYLN